MAHAFTLIENRFRKMSITELEYRILKVAEDHRAGREFGSQYYGTHTQDEALLKLYQESGGTGALNVLDDNGIIEPYGHPFRFVVTEKGRLLLRIYELEHGLAEPVAA